MEGIHLGFEVGTGEPVTIPLHHLVVSGVTGLSGKTTSLEALISRGPEGYRALTFRTKRGELAFSAARKVPPYYREEANWRYVESLLEATLRERLKFERSWLIKACKGASALVQVHKHIKNFLSQKKLRGLDESVYTNLDAYFDLVLPQLQAIPLSQELHLVSGANVMDLVGISEEVQALIIRSTLQELWTKHQNVIVVIPEAWLFLPQGRGNPVKDMASRLIREGRSVGIWVWLDSQDITGIEKAILKSCDIWLLGRQRELNEVERTLDQLPAIVQKPRPEEVMTLPLGHFFVAAAEFLKKVYVQPAWMEGESARNIALGVLSVKDYIPPKEEDPMLQESVKELERLLVAAKEDLARAQAERSEYRQALEQARSERQQMKEVAEQALKDAAESNKTALENREAAVIVGKLREVLILFLPKYLYSSASLDAIVKEVLARLPDRPILQAAPLEALKEKYHQEAVERLHARVAALTENQRRALEWLIAVAKAARANEIVAGVGAPRAGSGWQKFTSELKALPPTGLVALEKVWYKARVREAVEEELRPYEVSPETVEQVFAHLVARLVREENRAG